MLRHHRLRRIAPALVAAGLVSLGLAAASCSGSAEPERVEVPVEVDGSQLAVATTALGYRVTLTAFRLAVRDLQFTVQGEMHARKGRGARWLERLARRVVPWAHAHPGHYAGGDVTGELPGRFLVDFVEGSGQAMGRARLLVGDYNGANFYLTRAGAEDGLDEDDVLFGHTAYLAGTAEKDGRTVAFTAVIDLDEGTLVVGAPFRLAISSAAPPRRLAFQARPVDPVEGDTLFDEIDFFALDPKETGQVDIRPGDEAHNRLRRTLVLHDQYFIDGGR